jgi:hypothetical protein
MTLKRAQSCPVAPDRMAQALPSGPGRHAERGSAVHDQSASCPGIVDTGDEAKLSLIHLHDICQGDCRLDLGLRLRFTVREARPVVDIERNERARFPCTPGSLERGASAGLDRQAYQSKWYTAAPSMSLMSSSPGSRS